MGLGAWGSPASPWAQCSRADPSPAHRGGARRPPRMPPGFPRPPWPPHPLRSFSTRPTPAGKTDQDSLVAKPGGPLGRGGGSPTRQQFKTGGAAQHPAGKRAVGAKLDAPQEVLLGQEGLRACAEPRPGAAQQTAAARAVGVTARPSRPHSHPACVKGPREDEHAHTQRPRSRPAVWTDPGGPGGLCPVVAETTCHRPNSPLSLETRSQRPHSLRGPWGGVPPARPASSVAHIPWLVASSPSLCLCVFLSPSGNKADLGT